MHGIPLAAILKKILCFSNQVAVRSSGLDEDTVDLSAAGQLETFLGVSGIESVSIANLQVY